jgi:hypothetical protein
MGIVWRIVSSLVDLCLAYGGDVASIGAGLIVIEWTFPEAGVGRRREARALRTAARCARAVVSTLHGVLLWKDVNIPPPSAIDVLTRRILRAADRAANRSSAREEARLAAAAGLQAAAVVDSGEDDEDVGSSTIGTDESDADLLDDVAPALKPAAKRAPSAGFLMRSRKGGGGGLGAGLADEIEALTGLPSLSSALRSLGSEARAANVSAHHLDLGAVVVSDSEAAGQVRCWLPRPRRAQHDV